MWRVEERENRTPGLAFSHEVSGAAVVGAAVARGRCEAEGSSAQAPEGVRLEAQVWAISLPGL